MTIETNYQTLINKNINSNNITKVQNALRFCLSFNEISTVIPGMMKIKEVKENVESINKPPFIAEEKCAIKKINQQFNF